MFDKKAFDLEKYLRIQKEEIFKRINSFGSKLYLEFGGKLFDDYHASRVLPGFKANTKLQLLLSLKDQTEIVIVVNGEDINSNKVRNDFGITYSAEVERLINAFERNGLMVNGVVISFYKKSPLLDEFAQKLRKRKIKMYKSYEINGYPRDIPLILSEEGLGRNEYIETTKPLVVITAPGPNSGKMAACLSQLYHDNKRGIKAGYAKYETFPIWNLPLNHPVNLAYEAATVDIDDVNMIDPYHLEAYKKLAVNYNRDVETFPLLKAIFDKIYGKSPYNSPTDMGVNMAGFAIKNDDIACESAKQEIVRRYYEVLKNNFLGRYKDEAIPKIEMLMNKVNASVDDRPCVAACLAKEKESKEPSMAAELPDGTIITGHRSDLLGASAALLLNCLKYLAGINKNLLLIQRNVIEPMVKLKVDVLHNNNPRIHAEEILIALTIQARDNPLADMALQQISNLKGAQAHSSCILSDVDLRTFNKIGMNVTEEPISYVKNINVIL